MAERRPLVLIDGIPEALPLGDSLPGVSLGGGALPQPVEINLGTTPCFSGNVLLSGFTGLMVNAPVQFAQVLGPYTGKGTLADEFEMDGVAVAGVVISPTEIRAYWRSSGLVSGNVKFLFELGAVTLVAPSFSASSLTIGAPTSGTINNVQPGAAVAAAPLAPGFTINGPARTWAYDGTGPAAVTPTALTVALAGATNSPLTVAAPITVEAAAPAVMPAGADLLLYSSDVAAGSNIVRNRAVATPVATNLFGHPRQSQNPYKGIARTNAVARTQDVAGEDAQNFATRFVYASGASAYGGVHDQMFLPAGTYIESYRIKSNTTDVNVRISSTTSNYSANLPVLAASWTTIEQTFTIGAGGALRDFSIAPDTLNTPFDVAVDTKNLTLGTVSGAITGNERHLMAIRKPNMNGGVIETSTVLDGRMALNLFDAETAQTELSVVAAVRMDPAFVDTAATFNFIINELETSNEANSSTAFAVGTVGYSMFAPMGNASGAASAGCGPAKAGWIVIAATAGPSGSNFYMNGVQVAVDPRAYASTFRTIQLLAIRNALGFSWAGKTSTIWRWPRKLTDAEVRDHAFPLARAEIIAAGETWADFANLEVVDGDSLTRGTGDATFGGIIARSGRKDAIRTQSINYAVAGSIITADGSGPQDLNAVARLAQMNASTDEGLTQGKRVIVPILIGANMSGISDANASYNTIRAYMLARRARGANVRTMLCTITAINGGSNNTTPTFNPNQVNIDNLNTLIRAGHVAGDFDALCDLAATALGTWSTTNFVDFVHWNPAGHEIAAITHQAARAPLLI